MSDEVMIPQMMEERPIGVSGLSVRCNRARDLFNAAALAVEPEARNLIPPVCFTHWETYGGATLETSDLPAGTRIVTVLERVHANRLSNKSNLARLLDERGLSHLAPATYRSVAEALAHSGAPVPVWFFKHIAGTAGKNMYCVANADLSKETLPPHYIIQAEIGDLELIDGCKFTSRIYVLLWDGRAWLYRDGFTLKHGVPYRAGSTEFGVQIDHRGYHLDGSQVRMEALSRYARFDASFPVLTNLVRELMPVIDECRAHTGRDSYLLLGIDILFQTNDRVQLVEINTSPNFVHSDDINTEVNIPFFEAVIRTILGREDERLLEIT